MTTTDKIIEIIRDVTEMGGEIQPDCTFHDIGLDSLDVADCASAIEEHFGVELTDAQIEDACTPSKMAAIVDKLTGETP